MLDHDDRRTDGSRHESAGGFRADRGPRESGTSVRRSSGLDDTVPCGVPLLLAPVPVPACGPVAALVPGPVLSSAEGWWAR